MGSDEATPAPTVGTLLRRGATKRCPNCGAGDLYRGWFQMAEPVPTLRAAVRARTGVLHGRLPDQLRHHRGVPLRAADGVHGVEGAAARRRDRRPARHRPGARGPPAGALLPVRSHHLVGARHRHAPDRARRGG
ncbi:MAG: hypothetical protein R2711_12210 [Acidimicrobiales bacterium]